MAVPTSFAESNGVLGKPREDTGDDVEALSVLHARMETSETPVVVSCWKLTAEELAEVNRTGRVWLVVMGETMPPAFVKGTKPFEAN